MTHPNPKDPQADIREAILKRVLKIDVYDDTEIDEDEAKAATDDLLKLFQAHQQELLTELLGEAESTFAYSDCGGVHPECSKRCVGHPRIVKSAIPVSVIQSHLQGEQLDSLNDRTESRPPEQNKTREGL